jgi:hypothetical protein
MQLIQSIQNRIYEIRGERVMLDMDLAQLYEVETRSLNQAVKRNLKRFPPDFMFQLTKVEWEGLQPAIASLSNADSLRSQTVILKNGRGSHLKYMPHAFTEQGVSMLSSVLNSDKAINMNITIMRVFVDIRKTLLLQTDLKEQLHMIRQKLGDHDAQLNQVYEVLENLLDEKASQKKWEERDRIGYK